MDALCTEVKNILILKIPLYIKHRFRALIETVIRVIREEAPPYTTITTCGHIKLLLITCDCVAIHHRKHTKRLHPDVMSMDSLLLPLVRSML